MMCGCCYLISLFSTLVIKLQQELFVKMRDGLLLVEVGRIIFDPVGQNGALDIGDNSSAPRLGKLKLDLSGIKASLETSETAVVLMEGGFEIIIRHSWSKCDELSSICELPPCLLEELETEL
jgi:hypothetical protein